MLNTDKQSHTTIDSISISDHIVFFWLRHPLKKLHYTFRDICPLASVTEPQPPQNIVFMNLWKCQPSRFFSSFFPQHKSRLQVCVHLKSDCRQLSTASPYGPCIYGVMRPAPGVHSGHYLGDAAAPVVKVTWYTGCPHTPPVVEDTKCVIISEPTKGRVCPDWPL